MKEFLKLLNVADALLGPDGCPWDKKQTFQTLQKYLLEETHELLEALDNKDTKEIIEELGDVFYVLIFICKIAENKKLFAISDVFEKEAQKLVHRHPHVFGDKKAENIAEIWKLWDEAKQSETEKKSRKSALDGIPPTLPLLLRAQKFFQKTKKDPVELYLNSETFDSEDELGIQLMKILKKAESSGYDAESVLRRVLVKEEKAFREKEKTTGDGLET